MEYDLVILTTAVTRPDLHSEVFPLALKTLGDLKYKWIINVDEINNKSVVETIDNLKGILNFPNGDIEFLHTNEYGGVKESFFNSVKNLMETAIQYNPKIGFYWLEDDWVPTNEFDLYSTISNIDYHNENWYISLASRNCISFNPGIWSKDVFRKIGYNKITTVDPTSYNYNPERTCVNVGTDPFLTTRMLTNFYSFNCMKDIGRAWQQKVINGKRTFQIN